MDLEKRVEMLEKRIDKLESENMKERLTGLKVGDYFEVAGTKWRILDIKPCGYVCLSDVLEESRTFDSETNNWKSSSLRKYLNNDFYKKIVDEIGEENILPFGNDLLSLDGQTEYGNCTDYVSLLSIDDYRLYRKLIPNNEQWWWLLTPWSTPCNGYETQVSFVSPSGGVNGISCCSYYGVRPLCIFSPNLFESE